MEENLKKLESWYREINPKNNLTFKETRLLTKTMLKTEDFGEKRRIRNEIFSGMLHCIYKYIKKSGILYINNVEYDVDDIINSFCEVTIEMIDEGRLLGFNSYFDFFNEKFFYVLSTRLGVPVENLLLFINCSESRFDYIMNWFIKERESGNIPSYDEFKEMVYNFYENTKRETIDKRFNNSGKMFYNLLNQIWDDYSFSDSKISRYRMKNYKYLIMNEMLLLNREDINCVGMSDPTSGDLPDSVLVDEIIRLMCKEGVLGNRSREVLIAYYGLDGEKRNLVDLAKEYNISHQRVTEIKNRAIGRVKKLVPYIDQ